MGKDNAPSQRDVGIQSWGGPVIHRDDDIVSHTGGPDTERDTRRGVANEVAQE